MSTKVYPTGTIQLGDGEPIDIAELTIDLLGPNVMIRAFAINLESGEVEVVEQHTWEDFDRVQCVGEAMHHANRGDPIKVENDTRVSRFIAGGAVNDEDEMVTLPSGDSRIAYPALTTEYEVRELKDETLLCCYCRESIGNLLDLKNPTLELIRKCQCGQINAFKLVGLSL